ncbi:NAD(P)/FAD-dependent oxidoreductase [Aureibaculum marinum]|uniref:NAD(P)/FAD-dependent oxidoreductase n=1 Tax=Aureibaculum marinum TaxID=2487930 RepID=A0A3N4P1A1_9FLAO|nr:NAD(P)/FAD-dependent oxidoreductase [Aureibaculum marinum]
MFNVKYNKLENLNNLKFDTIIVGSGVGGLSTAICLSRAGQKVLVLEQHDVPGGWCHSFYLNGYRFTPGVHYIGLLGKGEATSLLYEGLGIANDLVFYKMNPNGYEHCWIGDKKFDFPANINDLKHSLSVRFPEEKKQIHKYLTLVENVSTELQLIPKLKGFWQHLTIPYRTRHMGKYALFSLKKVINWHIKNPLLKKILNIQYGDHGLPPSKAPFPLHCAVMGHYFNGGYYPMGGGGAIVKAMTKSIKNYGGKVRTNHSVKSIVLEGIKKKKAIGVVLENGQKVFANTIVSNADPGITFLNLIGKKNISTKLLNRLNKTKYSCTSLMLFLTVDMDLKKAGIDSGNIWMMPNKNMDDLYDDMQKVNILDGEEFSGLFISCTTLKDPASFDGRYHTMEVITYINHNSFNQFKNEKDRKRSAKYKDFKNLLIDKILRSLEKVVPGISDNIVYKDLGTPLTNKFYINSTNGNVYGTEKNFNQIGPFAYKANTEIENLYLCGASILSHGVAGASYSGVETAATILGCKQDDLLKPDSTQNIQIYEAENDCNYPEWMKSKIKAKRNKRLLK